MTHFSVKTIHIVIFQNNQMCTNPVEMGIDLIRKRAKNAIPKYCLYHFNENFDINENQVIIQKIIESKLVIISILNEDTSNIFIGFKETIIHLQNSSLKLP